MPRRKNSLRLKGYDYSRHGAYFVTMVTKSREPIFGNIANGEMVMNDLGNIVNDAWLDLPNHYDISLDKFIIMPNHVHGIIFIDGDLQTDDGAGHVGVGLRPTPTVSSMGVSNQSTPHKKPTTLSEIVRAFKSFTSRRINEFNNTPGIPIWQRGFHDRIIRSEEELNNICVYIQTNPQRWSMDLEFL